MADGGNFDPDSLLTAPPPASASMVIRPSLPQPALSPPMRALLETMIAPGESGGKYNVIYGGQTVDDLSGHPDIAVPITSGPNVGKNSTAAGKYQFIKSTWDEAAKALGLTDFSPASQDKAAAWLAKRTYQQATGRDIESDYASGDPSLREGIRQALSSQWEALGKPGPRQDKLWTLGNDRLRFSDEAMSADDLHYMHPDDYLTLSPSMQEDGGYSGAGWQALRTSLANGETINHVPGLTTENGKVTAQDGRSRALLAKLSGLEMLPVSIKGGVTTPEIEGMSGAKVPAGNLIPGNQMERSQSGGSLLGKMLGIGSAQAAEPGQNPFAKFATPENGVTSSAPEANKNPFARFAPGATPASDDLPWDVPMTGAQMRENQRQIEQADKALPLSSMEPKDPGLKHLLWSAAAGPLQTAAKIGQTARGQRPIPTGVEALQEASLAVDPARPGREFARGPKTPAAPKLRPGVLEARQAGYVLPPDSISESPGLVARIMAGWSGKIKTQQAASEANQAVTNSLASRALGLPPDTMLTDEVFHQLRATAGKAYQAVESAIPVIEADEPYIDAVSALGGKNSQAAKMFPRITANPGIKELVEELNSVGEFPTPVGVELVKELRFNANSNLKAIGDPSKHALGLAQRQAADAIDGLMERRIEASGQPGLVDAYRAARRLIAKSYDVEGATNTATGDVNARGLARLADKGRPLTDELETIANAAAAFPKAMQPPVGFGHNESWSALDFFGGAAAVAHGNPGIAAGIMLRPAARAALLSRPAQDAMTSPRMSLPTIPSTMMAPDFVPPQPTAP